MDEKTRIKELLQEMDVVKKNWLEQIDDTYAQAEKEIDIFLEKQRNTNA